MDYCFLGDEFGYKCIVLAGSERLTGMRFATVVPTKAVSGKFATDRVLYVIAEVRDSENKTITKNDQEHAIQYLINDLVSETAEGRAVLEEFPAKRSSRNGVVEWSMWEG